MIGPGFEVSSAVVAKQDWVGEASRLSAEGDAQSSGETEPRRESRASVTCLVELRLDDDRKVRETRVRQPESGREEVWTGWDPARLTRFLGLVVQGPGQVPATVRLRELEVIPQGATQPSRTILPAQPYRLRVVADASEIVPPGQSIFSVTVGAKLAGHRRAMMLAVSTDAVPIAPTMSFELDGKPLPPGLYLLFVVIRIGSTTAFGAEAGTLSVLEKAVS